MSELLFTCETFFCLLPKQVQRQKLERVMEPQDQFLAYNHSENRLLRMERVRTQIQDLNIKVTLQ